MNLAEIGCNIDIIIFVIIFNSIITIAMAILRLLAKVALQDVFHISKLCLGLGTSPDVTCL